MFLARLEDYDGEPVLRADGFDNCIIGLDTKDHRIIYSVQRIIDQLVSEGLTEDDAYEHFGFNIDGAFMSHGLMPIFCDDTI